MDIFASLNGQVHFKLREDWFILFLPFCFRANGIDPSQICRLVQCINLHCTFFFVLQLDAQDSIGIL